MRSYGGQTSKKLSGFPMMRGFTIRLGNSFASNLKSDAVTATTDFDPGNNIFVATYRHYSVKDQNIRRFIYLSFNLQRFPFQTASFLPPFSIVPGKMSSFFSSFGALSDSTTFFFNYKI